MGVRRPDVESTACERTGLFEPLKRSNLMDSDNLTARVFFCKASLRMCQNASFQEKSSSQIVKPNL